MPDVSVVDKLREAFKVEPPEPPPAGMTFEQRAALIASLFALREPGQLSLNDWALQLRQALLCAEITKPLADTIPLDDPAEGAREASTDTETPSDAPFLIRDSANAELAQQRRRELEEKRRELLSAVSRAGLRLAELHPVAAFGGDARQLLAEHVDRAVARSKPFLLGRWALPAIIAAIVGGTAWGVISIRGLEADLKDAKQQMHTMTEEVATAGKQAESDITKSSKEATEKLDNRVLDAVKQAVAGAENNIKQAEHQVAVDRDNAVAEFAVWKAQAKPAVDAELGAITAWGTTQKKQVSDAADKQRAELNSLLPAIEAAKAEAKPRVDAEFNGISDWGTVQKKQVSDMADKERGEIAALLPIVEKAKAEAQPTVAAELKGISDWGAVQKKQVSDVADRERSELDQDKQSIIGTMQQRQREVQDEADRAKTQFSGLLINVRQGEDDLEKRLLASEIGMKKLDDRMAGLRATVEQASRLQSALEQTDRTSKLNFATLIRVLEWKDLMAIAAMLLAALAVVLAIASFIRTLWRRPPREVGPANRAAA